MVGDRRQEDALNAARKEDEMREDSACPCLHTTPCCERCTCRMPASSSGCRRCCSYGSPEQQRTRAEVLARVIDDGLRKNGEPFEE